jgi:putative peptidoglycan lipid II flippase
VNVALAYVFFVTVPVDLRVPSLGLAYGIAYWVALAALAWRLRRRLGGLDGKAVIRSYVRVGIATLAAGLVMAAATWLYRGGQPLTSGVEAAIALLVGLGPAVLVFLAASRVMHIREVKQVTDLLLRRGRG